MLSLSVGCFIWAGGKIRTHISHDIRRDGFENLQRLSFSFYDHRPVGWLMARMTSDSERLANILAWAFLDIVWGVTLMLGIAIAMLVMNVKLALLALAVIPFLGWVSARFQKRMLRSAREVRRTNSRITGTYNESIMGVLTSKAFVRESENLNDFKQLTGKMYDASVREHDPGRGVRADHRHAREPRGGPHARGRRFRSAARRDQRRHAGRIHGVRAQLLRSDRTARPLVRRNADGAGIGRADHQPDRRGAGHSRF